MAYDQLLDATKYSAAQAIFGQVTEEALHHVQLRAADRREVHTKAGMTVEPALAPGMFVSGVVIHDHMDQFVFGNDVIDGAQELEPFLMAVPVVAHRDYLAFKRVQAGEQLGLTIALVIVGYGSAAAFLHRQPGLAAVQGLNPALLVIAQHHGMLGRIQMQACDVLQFFLELRIAAELERPHLMRLQAMGTPDASHAGFADASRRAMVRVDQGVAFGGLSRSVICTTVFTTRCTRYARPAEDRGASASRSQSGPETDGSARLQRSLDSVLRFPKQFLARAADSELTGSWVLGGVRQEWPPFKSHVKVSIQEPVSSSNRRYFHLQLRLAMRTYGVSGVGTHRCLLRTQSRVPLCPFHDRTIACGMNVLTNLAFAQC